MPPEQQDPDALNREVKIPNQKLRVASYVFGAVTLLGVLILAYVLIWVEKLSGQQAFSKTFYKGRIVQRAVDKPASPPRVAPPSGPTGAPAPRAPMVRRQEEVVETVMKADTVGPVHLTQADSPCRLFLDVTAAIFDPGKLTDEVLTCELAMFGQGDNERWRISDQLTREIMSERELSSYSMAVHEFNVPYEGDFTFRPTFNGPGVFVQRAKLTLRRKVQRSSPVLLIVGASMFFVGLLVAISCSKAYELSKPESERSAWVDQPFALGDPSLRQPPGQPEGTDGETPWNAGDAKRDA